MFELNLNAKRTDMILPFLIEKWTKIELHIYSKWKTEKWKKNVFFRFQMSNEHWAPAIFIVECSFCVGCSSAKKINNFTITTDAGENKQMNTKTKQKTKHIFISLSGFFLSFYLLCVRLGLVLFCFVLSISGCNELKRGKIYCDFDEDALDSELNLFWMHKKLPQSKYSTELFITLNDNFGSNLGPADGSHTKKNSKTIASNYPPLIQRSLA